MIRNDDNEEEDQLLRKTVSVSRPVIARNKDEHNRRPAVPHAKRELHSIKNIGPAYRNRSARLHGYYCFCLGLVFIVMTVALFFRSESDRWDRYMPIPMGAFSLLLLTAGVKLISGSRKSPVVNKPKKKPTATGIR